MISDVGINFPSEFNFLNWKAVSSDGTVYCSYKTGLWNEN